MQHTREMRIQILILRAESLKPARQSLSPELGDEVPSDIQDRGTKYAFADKK
jgi:hypothetical protein